MKLEYALANDRGDGRSAARLQAEAIRLLRTHTVRCARCRDRATLVADDGETLVCRACRKGNGPRSVAALRARLAATLAR